MTRLLLARDLNWQPPVLTGRPSRASLHIPACYRPARMYPFSSTDGCEHSRPCGSLELAATSMNGTGNVFNDTGRIIGSREGASAFWTAAYEQLAQDACSMGVPASAVPKLPPNASEHDVISAHRLLEAIIASFLSSGL